MKSRTEVLAAAYMKSRTEVLAAAFMKTPIFWSILLIL
jgi:hypothetical protein